MKPKRYKPEFALQAWAEDRARAFVFPDLDTIAPAGIPGGGGGAPTIVVAAADASDLSKSKADLVCTGTADHVIIQQAIDALPPAGVSPAFGGGRVLLTEGVYNVEPNQMDMSDRRATLQGMGASTRIRTTTASGVVLGVGDFSVIRDVYFQGSSTEAAIGGTQFDIGIGTGGNGVLVDHCLFNGFDADMYLSGNQWIIRGCRLDGGDPIFVTAGGQSFQSIMVIGNVEVSDILIAGGDYWVVDDNVLLGGISCDAATQPLITNNSIQASSPAPGAQAMIEISNTDGAVVADNTIDANGWGGVFLDTSDDGIVDGNRITGPDTGIEVNGDGNLVHGNTINPGGADVGINVTGGNDNAVYANYLGDSSAYGTADSVDSGTNTQTTPAAGAIGGQFAF